MRDNIFLLLSLRNDDGTRMYLVDELEKGFLLNLFTIVDRGVGPGNWDHLLNCANSRNSRTHSRGVV